MFEGNGKYENMKDERNKNHLDFVTVVVGWERENM